MRPWVTGYPHLVATCGSSPASRWASAISCVLIVYPALVVGQRVGDQVQHPPRNPLRPRAGRCADLVS